MRFIGVDVGLDATGFASFDSSQHPKFRLFTCNLVSDPKRDTFQRQVALLKQLRRVLKKDDIVAFEQFGDAGRFSGFSSKLASRIELLGMMKLVVRHVTKRHFLEVHPVTLRTFISGSVSGGKDSVKKALWKRWKVETMNDDEADAMGLALYAFGLWVAQTEGEYDFAFSHKNGRVEFDEKQRKHVLTNIKKVNPKTFIGT